MSRFTNEKIELFNVIMEAIAAIHEKEFGQPRPNYGVIDCPRCGHRLAYSIATNGHTHGCCKTEGCLQWMQ